MKIPNFLIKDAYLQNPIMRRFLKEHKLDFVDNKTDYIKTITAFANLNKENEKEVLNWLLKVSKEGSKEICYRKIYGIEEYSKNPSFLENIIKDACPDCPMKNILSYKNTHERKMIEYKIITNDNNEAIRIDFTFSRLFFYKNGENIEGETVFPIFIEVYLDKGFIISRAKAKSTLCDCRNNEQNNNDVTKINTIDYAISTINAIIHILNFNAESNTKIVNSEVSQMLYGLYKQYSFTPEDIEHKINSQNSLINEFVNHFFDNLHLNIRNKESAIMDTKILLEKYISVNGDTESIFKNDRDAYLTKIRADDESELTIIDTTSYKSVPLQCTEAFFDSKKYVIRSKACKRLKLIFKRIDETYFKGNPLVVWNI